MRVDGRVARRGGDPVVRREQVVRALVEERDPSDHGGERDEVVAAVERGPQHAWVARVAAHLGEARVVVVGPRDRPVLRVVVDTDHVVAAPQQLGHEIRAEEPRGARHQHALGDHGSSRLDAPRRAGLSPTACRR